MTHDVDIAISGGGLNGTTLALALASGGFRVALVDPVSEERRRAAEFDGRGYALARGSQQVLSALGLWKDLAADAQPITDIRITDGRVTTGPAPFEMLFEDSAVEGGPMGFMVEDRHLRRVLLDRVGEAPEIRHVSGALTQEHVVHPGHVKTGVSDGSKFSARLLVGCDGAASPTAQRAGIRRHGWEYGQTALVAAIAHDHPHHGRASQFFLPGGPMAILPLTGNRSSIVWSERTEVARAVTSLDDPGFLSALRPRFDPALGDVELCGPRASFPLRLSLAERLTSDRVALLGDAAHVVHPIAGQGLNAGLKDVAALSEVLVDAARRGEDIGSSQVLERYARWRRFDIMSLAIATDGFNRLFSNDLSPLRALRGLGMAALNQLPGIRQGFIREAAGIAGDTPRLARGEPL